MTQHLTRFISAVLLAGAVAAPAQAGPFNGAAEVALPAVPETNFVQLKQVNGFTGQLTLSESNGDYEAVGNSFNKLAKFQLSVNCPSGYHPDNAGVRIRGADVVNFNLQLLAPGSLAPGQTSWQQIYDNEPWKFAAVVDAGGDALDAAGNNGPVYVSLDQVLDSRTEFYGWCIPDSSLSGETAFYYDSAQEGADLYPMTRVRYQGLGGTAIAPRLQAKTAPQAVQHRDVGVKLQVRPRLAVPQAQSMQAPGGCPYDCPPPVRSLRLSN
jgi:hypothetical protein